MDLRDPRLNQFIMKERPPHPLKWHTHDMSKERPHYTTQVYVRILLDFLQGDERRSVLRRVYRFYRKNCGPNGYFKVASHWILIEAANDYSHILPPDLVPAAYTPRVPNLRGY